jgi:hypothetical protein
MRLGGVRTRRAMSHPKVVGLFGRRNQKSIEKWIAAGARPPFSPALGERVGSTSRVNVPHRVYSSHPDLLLALAGLGDVVGRLHPHQRVHLYAKGLLDALRHVSGKIGLAVKQAGQCGSGTPAVAPLPPLPIVPQAE